jgi:hypothetical protein
MFVYKHINAKTNEVFYVGKSISKSSRPYQRSKSTRSSKWWDYFTKECGSDKTKVKVVIEKCKNEGEALSREWHLIRELCPVANTQYMEENALTKIESKTKESIISDKSAFIRLLGITPCEYDKIKPIGKMSKEYVALFIHVLPDLISAGLVDKPDAPDFVSITDAINIKFGRSIFGFMGLKQHEDLIDLLDGGLSLNLGFISNYEHLKQIIDKL